MMICWDAVVDDDDEVGQVRTLQHGDQYRHHYHYYPIEKYHHYYPIEKYHQHML